MAEAIKNELQAANVYAEGRGIRIDIKDSKTTEDILKLIGIKIAFWFLAEKPTFEHFQVFPAFKRASDS